MTIDTKNKRFSILNLGDGSHIYLTPDPDGSFNLGDQQHFLDCYSGIPFGPPPVVDVERWCMLNFWDGTNITVLPQADGSFDQSDRQHMLDCYCRIPFDPPPPPPEPGVRNYRGFIANMGSMTRVQ